MIDPFFRLCQEEEETTQVEETEETPEELPRVPRDASTAGVIDVTRKFVWIHQFNLLRTTWGWKGWMVRSCLNMTLILNESHWMMWKLNRCGQFMMMCFYPPHLDHLAYICCWWFTVPLLQIIFWKHSRFLQWSKVPCHIFLPVVPAARVIGKGGASIKVGVWHWINLVLGWDNESRMSLVSSWKRCSGHIYIIPPHHYKEKRLIFYDILQHIMTVDPQPNMSKRHGKKQNISDFSDSLPHRSEQLSPCNGWMLTVVLRCFWGHSWTEPDS